MSIAAKTSMANRDQLRNLLSLTLPQAFWTLRYLRADQVVRRIRRKAAHRLVGHWTPQPTIQSTAHARQVPAIPPEEASHAIPLAAKVLERGYECVGMSGIDVREIDWRALSRRTDLWALSIQYMDWLPVLGAAHESSPSATILNTLLESVERWISANPPSSNTAWHPYALAKRIRNWAQVWHLVPASASPSWVRSLYIQAHWLEHMLEYDLRNNHVITELHALFTAGNALRGMVTDSKRIERWRRVRLAEFVAEVERQVRPDGFHVENSTSYQVLVVQEIVEALQCMASDEVDLRTRLLGLLDKTALALSWLVRAGQRIPLLNDAVEGYPLAAAHVIGAASRFLSNDDLSVYAPQASYAHRWTTTVSQSERRSHADSTRLFLDTGLWIYAHARDYGLLDAATLGPDENPGHGHADALSIVIYREGSEVLVDPGTYEYGNGRIRNYYRSTDAHNTATVVGAPQAEFWGAFRVGRRPKPAVLDYSDDHCTATCMLQQPRGGAIEHRRTLRKTDRGWQIDDQFSSTTPLPHVQLNFQFGSDYDLDLQGVVATFRARTSGLLGTIRLLRSRDSDVAGVTISPGFVSRSWRQQEVAPRFSVQAQQRESVLRLSVLLEFA